MALSHEQAEIIHRMQGGVVSGGNTVYAVIAAQPGEGATFCCQQLGEGAARALDPQPVLVCDLDPNDGGLSAQIDHPERGWTNWLQDGDDAPLGDVIVPATENRPFDVLPLGSGLESQPAATLYARLGQVLDKATQSYAVVLLDCPAYFQGEEGRLACRQAARVLPVIEAERTRKPVAQSMVNALRALGCEVPGVILNRRRFHIPDWIYRRMFGTPAAQVR